MPSVKSRSSDNFAAIVGSFSGDSDTGLSNIGNELSHASLRDLMGARTIHRESRFQENNPVDNTQLDLISRQTLRAFGAEAVHVWNEATAASEHVIAGH